MSAYVVDNEVINRILFAINHARDCREERTRFFPTPRKGILTVIPIEILGINMRNINELAVMQRYGEYDIDKLPGVYDENNKMIRYVYKKEHNINLMLLEDDLREYVYQCSEGDVVNDMLYLELSEYHKLVKEIISICLNKVRVKDD